MNSATKIAKILNVYPCRPSPFLKFLLEENFFNPNLGGLFRDSCWGGGVKLPPLTSLKLVRITLEIWNFILY